MKTLDELPQILDQMISSQKEKKSKTYVAKYKGQNLRMRSGKSSWKQTNHVKAALLNHFEQDERAFKYQGYDYATKGAYKIVEEKQKEFRAKLWELVEIVELT